MENLRLIHLFLPFLLTLTFHLSNTPDLSSGRNLLPSSCVNFVWAGQHQEPILSSHHRQWDDSFPSSGWTEWKTVVVNRFGCWNQVCSEWDTHTCACPCRLWHQEVRDIDGSICHCFQYSYSNLKQRYSLYQRLKDPKNKKHVPLCIHV